jgi:hypothetical protein
MHILKAFEKGVRRKMFGIKTDELAGGWRKLHSEALHEHSPLITRAVQKVSSDTVFVTKMEMDVNCSDKCLNRCGDYVEK